MMGATPALEEILLTVANLSTSREFYVGVLGFATEYEGDSFTLLRIGDGPAILLHDAEGEPVVPGSTLLEIRVDDVDRWYQTHAWKAGASVRPPFDVTHEGDRWSPRREVRLSDPDGYGIVLFTSKPRR
jgi:catechol 2,3-dioxygenase-like lactoylglutathione lyase family enzyme